MFPCLFALVRVLKLCLMKEQMWSLDQQGRIYDLLKIVVTNNNSVNVWQRSSANTVQARGVIKDLDLDKCTISFAEKVAKDFFRTGETLFVHCEGIDIIFKKESFSFYNGEIIFKTPTHLMVKEKRRIERLTFKYQDFKEVEFSFSSGEEIKKTKQMLLDISILGIGFLAPKSLGTSLEIGDEITIHMMTDQKLDSESFKATIVNCIENEEGNDVPDKYIKYGVEFVEPLELVFFRSKNLSVSKTQRRKMNKSGQ